MRTSVLQSISRMRTISRFDEKAETVVDILSEESAIARWAMLLGGFAVIRQRWLQNIYLLVFVGSFVACFSACLVNLFVKTPPYVNMSAELLTVYFHVVGVHTWICWRLFIKDPRLLALVQRIRASDLDSEVWDVVRGKVRKAARIFLVLQVLGVAWGYTVFSRPALNHWYASARETGAVGQHSPEHLFTLAHAIQMFISIPSHVPTLIASYGLFMFVNYLHSLDAGHVGRLLRKPPHLCGVTLVSTDHVSIADMCADMADDVQGRLDETCRRFGWLLVHQLAYIFFQLLFVAMDMKTHYDMAMRLDFSAVEIALYEGWHLYIGLIGLVALLLSPAYLTGVLNGLQEEIFKGLRSRGAHHSFAVQSARNVGYHITGFTLVGMQISMRFVLVFLSLVFSILSLHLDLGDR